MNDNRLYIIKCATLINQIQQEWEDSRKSQQKVAESMAHFFENGKNHGKVTASNYGPQNHYKVTTQHLALTTIVVNFCRWRAVKYNFL